MIKLIEQSEKEIRYVNGEGVTYQFTYEGAARGECALISWAVLPLHL